MPKKEEAILGTLLEQLDLPDSAYERAKKRYEDLGEWFNKDNSSLKFHNVHIFPQGSFMLGTSIRPVKEGAEYDLDLACKLREGISKNTHTQKQLKELVGNELETYRKARGIKESLEEKHRCWRLEYRDDISFHLDIVPAIPSDELKKSKLFESINNTGTSEMIAKDASETAVSITDDRDPFYTSLSADWNISNPEGYGIWFAEQMKTEHNRFILEKAQIDDVPIYKHKTPLQRCIQLLKRHRDIMYFKNEDSKPISIIITTLAARAYNGENNIVGALTNILEKMPKMLNPSTPRVPNPVNPEEDFSDRWDMEECRHLKLEDNFFIWIQQAQEDFRSITKTNDAVELNEKFNKKFAVNIGHEILKKKLGLSNGTSFSNRPKEHTIQQPVRPWKQ
ncbi:nucleotidyltransferase [Bacillus hwajinpoensis]|uniref:Cyclic GMP-AMP synthase n=1 Tax=Guptibacillus hwajinpoensis TaxID=208199 RepID=A0A845F0A0_9BACL|nr:nucleotidyltransferase [Pseudalkalibacillus hwajinpoensis]MYL64188.1 nucleotidyltransferase [Pseudalkalibacillus hwajinpoensis]